MQRHINKCPGFREIKHCSSQWWVMILKTSQSLSSGEARFSHWTPCPSWGALQLHIHNPHDRSASLGNCSTDLWHKPYFSMGSGSGKLPNVHTCSYHYFFSNFPRQEWAIKTCPERLVGKRPHKTLKINLPVDLCSNTTNALQSWLRTVSYAHQKLWTTCPEIQLIAGQS